MPIKIKLLNPRVARMVTACRSRLVRHMGALRAHAAVLFFLAAREAFKNGRDQGHVRRKQLRDERRLELFLRMDTTLTISLGAGTGMQLEDTSHHLALCRRAFLERKLAAPAREPLDNS